MGKGNSENTLVPLVYHCQAEHQGSATWQYVWGPSPPRGSTQDQCGFPPALTTCSENEEGKSAGCKRGMEMPRTNTYGELSFNYGLKSRKSDQIWCLNPRPPPGRLLTSLSFSFIFCEMETNNTSSIRVVSKS